MLSFVEAQSYRSLAGSRKTTLRPLSEEGFMAKLKFPVPGNLKAAEPAVLCPAERVLGLYNQETGKSAKKIAKSV
jgi:hypothetical protein